MLKRRLEMVVGVALAVLLSVVGLAGAEDKRHFDLLCLGKNGNEYIYQVTALRLDTISNEDDDKYVGFGSAIAYAIQQIAKNHTIKNVVPIVYTRKFRYPNTRGVTRVVTKQVIIFAVPKKK